MKTIGLAGLLTAGIMAFCGWFYTAIGICWLSLALMQD